MLVDTKTASEKILNNEVVALPTETVYGLAARIDHDEALNKIFSTKNRPFYDPLIVHVKNLAQAKTLGDWDELSLALAEYFWPGPLTLVVNRNEKISDLITSGGPTVAFRQPDHPLFQEVLDKAKTPLAAPSANRFGQTSPTTAQHVLTEFDNQVAVVDGGPCERGIESTVVQVSKAVIKILRPGFIGPKEITEFLEAKKLSAPVEFAQQNNSPGFLKNHYQPSSPFLFVEGDPTQEELNQLVKRFEESTNQKSQMWLLPNEAALAARTLYKDLREFSKNAEARFFVAPSRLKEEELWQSLMDRLQKAAHYLGKNSPEGWVLFTKDDSTQ